MIIHKFGGGVLNGSPAIRQLIEILEQLQKPTVVVVSALGKMTNAFEQMADDHYYEGYPLLDLETIYRYHYLLAEDLLPKVEPAWNRYMEPLFDEIKDHLELEPEEPFDRAYDQLVVYGELLSTALIRTVLEERGIVHHYLDARDVIVTDETYRDGQVDWEETQQRIANSQLATRNSQFTLCQGFIARSSSGHSITLGREGSDYTAAIFGYCLDAEAVWVWKDVPGVMNADPKEFADTCKLEDISYLEAIEMSFFGAKVLHPKTIKPLQNKSIPLVVKDFNDSQADGTLIHQLDFKADERPVFIRKRDQVLITFQPRDFSFIVEDMISDIFAALHRNRIRVNLMQHGAVSLTICVDAETDRINELISELLSHFRILYNTGLELLTIRRYNDELIRRMTDGKRVLVQQLSRRTARFVLSSTGK